MAIADSTYYGFTKLREMSPDARDWAATDGNFELISLVLKALEQHTHTGTTPIAYPGYNAGNPTNPTLATLTSSNTGGILNGGITVGARISYVNAQGLETDASPEATITLPVAADRPLTPILVTTTVASPGLTGGTYIYVVTKKNDAGETTPSDILAVDLGYDTTRTVTLQFDAISTYTDGTNGINIYRANGLNAPYQLLTTITGAATTTYVDNGTVPSANTAITPPASNTFNAVSKVRIDWTALPAAPVGATAMRVYVTQQTGMWGAQALLSEIDLTQGPVNYIDYLGSEILSSGYPKNVSQIPSSPPKINLGTQATGAPTLTANMNFAGYQALNLRLHNNSGAPASPTNGYIYYDTSTNNVRAYINGGWVNWGVTAGTAYVHPAEETGGHVAANIKFVSGSAVTAKTIFDTLRNSDGTQKNLVKVWKLTSTATNKTTASTSPVGLPEMDQTNVTPDFTGQWAEAYFTGDFMLDTVFANLIIAIEYDGSTIEETVRSQTAGGANAGVPFTIPFTFQLGNAGVAKRVRVLWWVSGGTATAVASRQALVVKTLA